MEAKDLKQDVFNRLVTFKDSSGMTLNAFSARIGMDQSTLHYQFHGKRALSLDTILNTISAYKELSAEWLLRGRGEMVVTNEKIQNETKTDERIEGLLETIQILSDTIRAKSRTIDALNEEISQLKKNIQEA